MSRGRLYPDKVGLQRLYRFCGQMFRRIAVFEDRSLRDILSPSPMIVVRFRCLNAPPGRRDHGFPFRLGDDAPCGTNLGIPWSSARGPYHFRPPDTRFALRIRIHGRGPRAGGDNRRRRRGSSFAGNDCREDAIAGFGCSDRVGDACEAWIRCCRLHKCRPGFRWARWPSAGPGRSTRPCWRRPSSAESIPEFRAAVEQFRAKQTQAVLDQPDPRSGEQA